MRGDFESEAATLLNNPDIKNDAVCMIYDDAVTSEDTKCLARIRSTYSREYLENVVGVTPEYLDEPNEQGEI